LRRIPSILAIAVFLAVLTGCGKNPDEQTDAELGLTPQQAQGRHVYRMYCAQCHSAYTSRGMKGPSLKGLYKKEYLPSGLLANDQFVEQSIVRGRKMMPATSLSKEQLDELMVYLHSL
jgi:cytochrome c2